MHLVLDVAHALARAAARWSMLLLLLHPLVHWHLAVAAV
jgi:hypothetical protein